jgi:hypothetical protein
MARRNVGAQDCDVVLKVCGTCSERFFVALDCGGVVAGAEDLVRGGLFVGALGEELGFFGGREDLGGACYGLG